MRLRRGGALAGVFAGLVALSASTQDERAQEDDALEATEAAAAAEREANIDADAARILRGMSEYLGRLGFAMMLLGAATLLGVGELPEGDVAVGQAHAVIGRPLTPGSVAGVSRRTSRRTTRRRTTVAGATVATLPAGCARATVDGVLVYRCGGSIYRPVYDGPSAVYVVE